VSPLPQVDYPTISVIAQLPGASPNHGRHPGDRRSTAARPHRRVSEITSSSSLGSTRITLQFDLDRKINEAATEVQSAINAARAQLPSAANNPTIAR